MIVGIGVDVVDMKRMSEEISRKVLTERELNELGSLKNVKRRIEYIAGRFAVKEAFFKALKTGIKGYSFKDIEILKGKDGQPVLRVLRDFHLIFNYAHVSISHDNVAVGMVVLEKQKGGVFVKGNIPDDMVLSSNGEIHEIEPIYGPFTIMEFLKKYNAKLVKYGNIWGEEF